MTICLDLQEHQSEHDRTCDLCIFCIPLMVFIHQPRPSVFEINWFRPMTRDVTVFGGTTD